MTGALRERLAVPALSRWWAQKTRRERAIIAVLALVVAIAILWLAVWRPMRQDSAMLRAAAPVARSELAEGERMAGEIAGLERAAPTPPPPEAQAALERIMNERLAQGGAAHVEWRDGRAHVALDAVRFDALVTALDALQREAQLRVVEATLTARVEPGTVRAELTVAH
jgi:general secretion pathway protein M